MNKVITYVGVEMQQCAVLSSLTKKKLPKKDKQTKSNVTIIKINKAEEQKPK